MLKVKNPLLYLRVENNPLEQNENFNSKTLVTFEVLDGSFNLHFDKNGHLKTLLFLENGC